jgi:hypothetical protein
MTREEYEKARETPVWLVRFRCGCGHTLYTGRSRMRLARLRSQIMATGLGVELVQVPLRSAVAALDGCETHRVSRAA